MLLFHKKDLLVVLTKDGDTVAFSKPIQDILYYQYRYNYKFKLYENGKVNVADDYIIEGETLTVFFGSAYVTYSSSGATYNEGGGSGGGDSVECNCQLVTETKFGEYTYESESLKFTYYYLDLLPEDTETNKIYFQSAQGVYTYVYQNIENYMTFVGMNIGATPEPFTVMYEKFDYSDNDFLPDNFNELDGKWVRVTEESIIG